MNPFDTDGLWMKARLFINRALDPNRDFEEQAFWACAALELVGKAALARVSPLLVANPNDDGKSLLVATGAVRSTDATSIQAKAVWARCSRLFRPFSDSAAKELSVGRNEYIHSALIGFDAVPEDAWWPNYWAQAVILLQHLEREVAEFVGSAEARRVDQHLAAQRVNIARRLEARLEHARSMLQRQTAGTFSARTALEWASFAIPVSLYSSGAVCPACGWEDAVLGGDERGAVTVEEFDDDYGVGMIVTLEISTEFIACPNCHLVINEYELLVQADVEPTFNADGDVDDLHYEEYNNE